MGQIPEIQTKAVIKPKMGDVRQLVLPGGGDVASRVWASMRVNTESLRKWMSKGAFSTAAAKDAINQLENFMIGEGQLYEHVWKKIDNKVALQIKVEIVFLVDAVMKRKIYDLTDLTKPMEDMASKAVEAGKAKARAAYEEQLEQSLKNGAGAAHKRTAVDHALHP